MLLCPPGQCCYARQDKVWVHGPGSEPWEVYVVKGDADRLDKESGSACCCGEVAGTDQAREPAATAGCC